MTAERLPSGIAKARWSQSSGFLLKPHRLETAQKSSTQDLVSIADRTTEAYLRKAIQKHFPDDGIIGEEAGSTRGTSGYIWVIDPLTDDGLSCRAAKLSVSIAVLKIRNRWSGWCIPCAARAIRRPDRSRRNFKRSISSINQDWTIRSTTIGYGGTERADPIEVGAFVTRLYQEGGVLFRVGSGALMLAYVAANRLLAITTRPFTVGTVLLALRLFVRRRVGGVCRDLTKPGPIWAATRRL